MNHNSGRQGVTFVELLIILVTMGLLAALSLPDVRAGIQRMRARGALDQVVAELYRARMMAVESGHPVRVILEPDGAGCVRRFRVALLPGGEERSVSVGLELPDLCLRHTGDSILTYNGRGMLRPPARSFRVTYGAFADSALLSIAGRIRRNY